MSSNSEKTEAHEDRLPDENERYLALKECCEEKFAQVLNDYRDSEGHPPMWAVICSSGRKLAVSVYSKDEKFPVLKATKCEDDRRKLQPPVFLVKDDRGTYYNLVGTIRDGYVKWLCYDPRYKGVFDDMTKYFNKDMTMHVRFFDGVARRRAEAMEAEQKAESSAQQSNEGGRAERKWEEAREKERRRLDEELKAQYARAMDDAAREAAVGTFNRRANKLFEAGALEARMEIVDPSTLEGAAALDQARERGYKLFPVIPVDTPED